MGTLLALIALFLLISGAVAITRGFVLPGLSVFVLAAIVVGLWWTV